MKVCNKCKIPKDLDDFSPDKRAKDGKQATCKYCSNLFRRNRYKTDENYKTTCKKRQKKYLKYANKKAKKHIQDVSDFYVIAELKRGTDLTTEEIKKFPHLIEAKRQVILNKRLCKTSKS